MEQDQEIIATIPVTKRDLENFKLVINNPDELSVTILRFARAVIRNMHDKVVGQNDK